MSSITKKTKQGVQPLAADDGILADSTSDGESPGVSEGDGPLRQADEACFEIIDFSLSCTFDLLDRTFFAAEACICSP